MPASAAALSISTGPPCVPIPYSIACTSEHSGRYVAENIKVDRPMDQTSRWSGANHNLNTKQWLLLELHTISVLRSIKFGKFHKTHPCNMKEFQLFVGLSEDHMTEVLHATLKNDSVPETFTVCSTSQNGVPFPTRFVKIVSLSAHGQNFNTSIWHVALTGIIDARYVEQVKKNYDHHREIIAMRQILKHLRQRRHISIYRQLSASTGVQLEHPLVSQLYDGLVLRGDWAHTEGMLRALSDAGLFDSYVQACQPQAAWTRLHGADANGDVPSRRGGHAMCMDAERGLIYLFGGWDGQKSLDDFWVYSVPEGRWRVISHSVEEEKNGPGPRACHKMAFDPKTGSIYVLGRLSDGDIPSSPEDTVAPTERDARNGTVDTPVSAEAASPSGGRGPADAADPSSRPSSRNHCSELFRYRTRGLDQGKWELLTFDTATSGGPPLVYDLQLVLDSEAQVLYVHGGRVVDGDWVAIKFSGLYSYDIRSSKWTILQPSSPTNETTIPPRFGHSMVLEPRMRRLFIFAGRQEEKYFSDMWEYNLTTNSVAELISNFTACGGPEACFAQRAVIDPNLREIYMLAGATKSKAEHQSAATVGTAVWVYRYGKRSGKWVKVLPQQADRHAEAGGHEQPPARWAHQVVYDPRTRTFYMHGGKAGFACDSAQLDGGTTDAEVESESRLDDFWSMTLKRPAPTEVIRRATFEVRRQQFREMCDETLPVKALAFLQTEVSSVVDHNNQEETTVFRSLLSHLLAPPGEPSSSQFGDISAEAPDELSPDMTSEDENESKWTSELPVDEDAVMTDADSPHDTEPQGTRLTPRSRSTTRVESDFDASALPESVPLSAAKFKQRTEVFESLLAFISPEAKQPSANLLDMLDLEEVVV